MTWGCWVERKIMQKSLFCHVFFMHFLFLSSRKLRRSRAKFRVSCHRLFVFCHGKQIEFFVTIKLKKSRELFTVFSREIGKLWEEKKISLSKFCSKLRIQICFLRTSSKWPSHIRLWHWEAKSKYTEYHCQSYHVTTRFRIKS